jgi:23S rRNA pseudouridine1911/1915/1917 synthase
MKLADWIISENDDFIALNKPSGLLSIPDREGKDISLKKILQEKYGQIFTVHRLDKDTSGLIIFAKNESSHRYLSELFQERQTKKIYLGLVNGSPAAAEGTLDEPIAEHPVKKGFMVVDRRGKEALTEYKVLKNFSIYSWLQFRIHTGRTHQIRVHMKNEGYPIACDELYGDGKPVLLSSFKKKFKLSKDQEEERPMLARLALHSWQLGFTDVSGNNVELEAPVPKEMRALLQQLEKWKQTK